MSKDVKENTVPVEPTTVYPQDQKTFHCVATVSNAPSGTKIKSVWVVLEAGDMKNMKIDSAEVNLDRDAPVHFTLSRGQNFWPVGKYQIELYLNNKFDRNVDFTVEKTTLLSNVTLCKDITEQMEPIAPTTVFSQDQSVFHCLLRIVNTAGAAKVKAVWIAVEAGASMNTVIDEATIPVDKDNLLHFSLSRGPNPWPAGKYRLDLFLNEKLKQSVDFMVQATANP
jgi:outer membrane usher protein FimD/PapC